MSGRDPGYFIARVGWRVSRVARTAAVTPAPITITTISGALRHAATAAAPTPAHAGVDLQVLADAERVLDDQRRDQRGRDQRQAALEHRRQRAVADAPRGRGP